MLDIFALIGIILAIVLITVGSKKHNKLMGYIGMVLILGCLIYIIPPFINGFIDGFTGAARLP